MFTVDGLGKDAGAGRLTHTTRSAKQVGVSQTAAGDGTLQRVRQRRLTHHATECSRPILSRRYDILVTHWVTKWSVCLICKDSASRAERQTKNSFFCLHFRDAAYLRRQATVVKVERSAKQKTHFFVWHSRDAALSADVSWMVFIHFCFPIARIVPARIVSAAQFPVSALPLWADMPYI